MRYLGLNLCFGTLLIGFIIQAEELTFPRPGNCQKDKPCNGKGACIQQGDKYRCSCYYPYYNTDNISCREVDHCKDSPCVNGGTCMNIWGNYFCECRRQFHGRKCQLSKPASISRTSKPLVLFNLEATELTYTTAFLIFDANIGSNMSFSLSFYNGSGLTIKGYANNLFEDVPSKLAQKTDLWKIPALKDKFATGKRKLYYYTYFYPRQNAEQKPEVLIVSVENGGVEQFSGLYSSNITKPALWCVPDITLHDCGESGNAVVQYKRNSKVVIRSELESECTGSGMATSWGYYILSTKQPFPFPFSYSKLDQGKNRVALDNATGKTSLEIEARTLNYGEYIIELCVTETPEKPTARISHFNIEWGWIRIVAAKLVASIANGTEVIVAKHAAITLDASKSYDPNESSEDNKSHLIFTWTCKPAREMVCKNTTFAGSVVNIENNLLNVGNYTFSVKISLDPAWVSATGKPLRYIPKPSSFTQTIVVIDDKITHLAIQCVKNCANGTAINIQDTIYLRVSCVHGCQGTDTPGFYKWSAIPKVNLSLQTTQSGDNSEKLIINPNVLEANKHYRFIVIGGMQGMAVFTLSTPPPLPLSNITCELDPKTGITGVTKFNLTCHGYPLIQDGFLLQYQLYQTNDPDNYDDSTLISYTFHPDRQNIVLMAGKPNLGHKVYLSFTVVDHNGLSDDLHGIASAEVKSFAENVAHHVEQLMGGSEGDLLAMLEISGKMSTLVSLISAGVSALDSATDNDVKREEKLRDSFLENIAKMPLINHESILQSLSVLTAVLGTNETARISNNGVKNAAQVIKDIAVHMHKEIVNLESDIHFTITEVENLFEQVMDCVDTIMATSEQIVKDFPIPPEQPATMAELKNKMLGLDYPDYTDVNFTYMLIKDNLQSGSESVVTAIKFLGMITTNFLEEGEKGREIVSKGTTSYVKVCKPTELVGQRFPLNNTAGVQLSSELAIAIEEKYPCVELHVALTSTNPFSWDPESKDINTNLLITYIRDKETGKRINFKEFHKPLDMFVSMQDPTILASSYHNKITSNISVPLASIHNDEVLEQYIKVHKIKGKQGSKPYLVFQKPMYKLMVVVSAGLRPSVNDFRKYSELIPHDVTPGIPLEESLSVHVQDSLKTAIREKEFFYVAVLPEFKTMEKEADHFGEHANLTLYYSFELFLTSCPMWDPETLSWDLEECQPGLKTTPETLHCGCHHLSSVMGSAVVRSYEDDPVNPVNIQLRLDNSRLVLFIVIILYVVFLFLFVWAHQKDKKDIPERALTILKDNIPGQKYPYLVIVFTDQRWSAGTTSNVFIEIEGANQTCEIHHLIDPRRKQTHKRGSDNWFGMYTSEWLGPLVHIKLWHDNSGHNPSWCCAKVIVHDLRRDEAWTFPVERWLSTTHDDGTVLRTVKPASREEVEKYYNLLKEHVVICLREDHYILNAFLRHPRSTYTRKQRLAVCFIMILGGLMAGMWELGVPDIYNPGTQIQEVAEDVVSISRILYAIKFEIPIVAICFTITLLFRKVAPKEVDAMYKHGEKYEALLEEYKAMDLLTALKEKLKGEKSTMEKVKEKEPIDAQNALTKTVDITVHDEQISLSSKRKSLLQEQLLQENKSLLEDHKPNLAAVTSVAAAERKLQKKSAIALTILDAVMMEPFILSGLKIYAGHSKMGEPLPQLQKLRVFHFRTDTFETSYYWFSHWMAYVLWITWLLIMAILTYYVLYYGSLLGTVKSLEWLKCVTVSILFGACVTQTVKAILYALILSGFYRTHAKPSQLHSGVWWDETDPLHRMILWPTKISRDQYRHIFLDAASPEVIKVIREKQLARVQLGRLISDIIMFMIYTATLYYIVLASRDSLAYYSTKTLEDNVIVSHKFAHIHSLDDFIHYLHTTLIPSVHHEQYYNGDLIEENGVVTTYVTKLLGIIRLRQLRVKADCKPEPEISRIYDRCVLEYSTENEDHNNYDIGWKPFNEKTFKESRATEPWLYSSPSDSETTSVTGELYTYPGGGYFTAFGRTLNNSQAILSFLVESSWFDHLTRAIIIDFSTYNANRNLFNVVVMTVEMQVSGALLITHSVTTERLLTTPIDLGLGMVVMTIMWGFMLFLFFGIQLIRAWKESLLQYFTTPWIVIDVFIILLGISMIIMNFIRNYLVSTLIRHLESVDYNEFVDFTWVGTWQIQLNYVMAVLVALSTARLWRLLRFGTQFQIVEKTLWLSAKCLMFLTFMMCILLLGFSSLAHVSTGHKIFQFSSLNLAFFCLLLYGFGFFHVQTVQQQAHSVLGRTFLIIYWLLYVVYLVNLFITVIILYYEQSKIYVLLNEKKIKMKSYILEKILDILGENDDEHDSYIKKPRKTTSPYTLKTSESSVMNKKQYTIQIVCMAIPKPMTLYFNRIQSIPVIRIKAMKALVQNYADLDREKLKIMKPIVTNELVEVCELKTPLHIEFYHCGFENNELQFVPDARLKEIERLLNGTLDEKKILMPDYIEGIEEALNKEAVYIRQIENQLDRILALLNQFKPKPRKSFKRDMVPEKHPKEITKKDLSPSKPAEITDEAERVTKGPEKGTTEDVFPKKIDLYFNRGVKVKIFLGAPKVKKQEDNVNKTT